jgi:hypothetical protein
MGAYVDIPSTFASFKPIQKLQILLGGIFHNAILGYCCYLLLSLPFTFYQDECGPGLPESNPVLVFVRQGTGFENYIQPGWVCTGVNDKSVKRTREMGLLESWNSSIQLESNPIYGLCVPKDQLLSSDCCRNLRNPLECLQEKVTSSR